jgi:hypothetical protein
MSRPDTVTIEFLEHIQNKFKTRYWNPLPRELADFWKDSLVKKDELGQAKRQQKHC